MYPKGAPSVLPLVAVSFSSSSSRFQAAPNKEETRDSQPEVTIPTIWYNLTVAHPHSGYSSTSFLVKLEFGNVSLWGEGNTVKRTSRKTSRSKGENQQQTQPSYGADAGIWNQATLVGGECFHHCATPASPSFNQHIKWPTSIFS